MEITNPKYIVLYRVNGISKELRFPRGGAGKADAIAAYREVKTHGEWAKLFSIDSDDSEIWYDLSNKY